MNELTKKKAPAKSKERKSSVSPTGKKRKSKHIKKEEAFQDSYHSRVGYINLMWM